jgi:hypothetical protein
MHPTPSIKRTVHAQLASVAHLYRQVSTFFGVRSPRRMGPAFLTVQDRTSTMRSTADAQSTGAQRRLRLSCRHRPSGRFPTEAAAQVAGLRERRPAAHGRFQPFAIPVSTDTAHAPDSSPNTVQVDLIAPRRIWPCRGVLRQQAKNSESWIRNGQCEARGRIGANAGLKDDQIHSTSGSSPGWMDCSSPSFWPGAGSTHSNRRGT